MNDWGWSGAGDIAKWSLDEKDGWTPPGQASSNKSFNMPSSWSPAPSPQTYRSIRTVKGQAAPKGLWNWDTQSGRFFPPGVDAPPDREYISRTPIFEVPPIDNEEGPTPEEVVQGIARRSVGMGQSVGKGADWDPLQFAKERLASAGERVSKPAGWWDYPLAALDVASIPFEPINAAQQYATGALINAGDMGLGDQPATGWSPDEILNKYHERVPEPLQFAQSLLAPIPPTGKMGKLGALVDPLGAAGSAVLGKLRPVRMADKKLGVTPFRKSIEDDVSGRNLPEEGVATFEGKADLGVSGKRPSIVGGLFEQAKKLWPDMDEAEFRATYNDPRTREWLLTEIADKAPTSEDLRGGKVRLKGVWNREATGAPVEKPTQVYPEGDGEKLVKIDDLVSALKTEHRLTSDAVRKERLAMVIGDLEAESQEALGFQNQALVRAANDLLSSPDTPTAQELQKALGTGYVTKDNRFILWPNQAEKLSEDQLTYLLDSMQFNPSMIDQPIVENWRERGFEALKNELEGWGKNQIKIDPKTGKPVDFLEARRSGPVMVDLSNPKNPIRGLYPNFFQYDGKVDPKTGNPFGWFVQTSPDAKRRSYLTEPLEQGHITAAAEERKRFAKEGKWRPKTQEEYDQALPAMPYIPHPPLRRKTGVYPSEQPSGEPTMVWDEGNWVSRSVHLGELRPVAKKASPTGPTKTMREAVEAGDILPLRSKHDAESLNKEKLMESHRTASEPGVYGEEGPWMYSHSAYARAVRNDPNNLLSPGDLFDPTELQAPRVPYRREDWQGRAVLHENYPGQNVGGVTSSELRGSVPMLRGYEGARPPLERPKVPTKPKKIAIVGGTVANLRGKEDITQQVVNAFVSRLPEGSVIVSGGANGADRFGEMAARARKLGTIIHPVPDEVKALPFGTPETKKAFAEAAFARNTKIAQDADEVWAFWDGNSRGTADTIKKAHEMGKDVNIWLTDNTAFKWAGDDRRSLIQILEDHHSDWRTEAIPDTDKVRAVPNTETYREGASPGFMEQPREAIVTNARGKSDWAFDVTGQEKPMAPSREIVTSPQATAPTPAAPSGLRPVQQGAPPTSKSVSTSSVAAVPVWKQSEKALKWVEDRRKGGTADTPVLSRFGFKDERVPNDNPNIVNTMRASSGGAEGGKWGNPYSNKEGTTAKFKVATNEEAVGKYREYLADKMRKDPQFFKDVAGLHGKILVCTSHAGSCHADVLAKAADWAYNQLNKPKGTGFVAAGTAPSGSQYLQRLSGRAAGRRLREQQPAQEDDNDMEQ